MVTDTMHKSEEEICEMEVQTKELNLVIQYFLKSVVFLYIETKMGENLNIFFVITI